MNWGKFFTLNFCDFCEGKKYKSTGIWNFLLYFLSKKLCQVLFKNWIQDLFVT